MQKFDLNQLRNLILGIVGILVIYCVSGVIHEYLIVLPYTNIYTGEKEELKDKAILVCFPTLVTWLIGAIYNKFNIKEKTVIPEKKSLVCGAIIFVSTITYTWATAMTSFPIVMAFKSCNILSILLVAILCTRVRDSRLKLGPKKIVVGIIISLGVFLFSFFDPEQKGRTQQSQYLGIFLLFISLLADSFLPDFQAEIKSQFKPQPTEMMQHINKWVALISLGTMLVSLTFVDVMIYTFSHPLFLFHLILLSVLSCMGQFVVYTMIKLFKQHIVPFVITTRKLLTVVLSIVWYQHETSPLQIVGMVIVFLAVIYEFASEIKKPQAKNVEQPQQIQFQDEKDFSETDVEYNNQIKANIVESEQQK